MSTRHRHRHQDQDPSDSFEAGQGGEGGRSSEAQYIIRRYAYKGAEGPRVASVEVERKKRAQPDPASRLPLEEELEAK